MILKRLNSDWLVYYGPSLIILCVAIVSGLCWLAAYVETGAVGVIRVAVVKEYIFSQQCGQATVTYTAPSRRPAADVCAKNGDQQ